MSFRSRSSGEYPPRKKKNKASLILPQTTISSLPDDLVLSCLARVSRLYYPTLSLVSKKFRSLIASPEVYDVRSLLGRTENCLFVCLIFPLEHTEKYRWFTFSRRLDTRKKKKKKKSKASGYFLVPIPSQHSPQALGSGVVAVGSNIYSIGGIVNYKPSTSVSILDCRSYTWQQAPNMQVARRHPAVNVSDGKIYVAGGYYYNTSNCIEVFDPKTQIWNNVSNPTWNRENINSTEIDGKIYMSGSGKCVAYNPKDGKFEHIEWDMCKAWLCYSHCVVDKVIFYYFPHEKVFKWYDNKARLWRNFQGLERIMQKIANDSSVELADYGGKIAVLWDVKYVSSSGCENKEIWCAVIEVERQDGDEIWGRVEWFDVVLTVPTAYHFVHVLATML